MAKFIIKYVVFILVFAVIRTKAEINKTVREKGDNKEKKKASAEELFARRFIEDLDSEQWLVVHLKESDFDGVNNARRSGCKELSFQEKVKKYRRSLKRDAGRMEYVSANTLPFDIEKNPEETCQIDDGDIIETTDNKTTVRIDKTTKTENVTTTDKIINAKVVNSTIDSASQNDSDFLTPIFKNDKRKSGDYLVSSVEYYDDVVEFDEKLCPSVVDVITLDQDMIRNYDVECELTLKWKSFEDAKT